MRRRTIFIVVVLIAIILNACAAAPATTDVPGMEQTLAVRTMVALQGVSYFATSTPTPAPISPIIIDSASVNRQLINTLPPTSSPVPSLTPISYVASLLRNGSGCTNLAEFVKDVTVDDYSEFRANQLFTKVWEVKNVGTCQWNTSYALVFTYGDRMSGLSPKPLTQIVKPGDTILLSIDLVAPRDSDTYQGNWMLQDENGYQFGTGTAAKDFFWVAIMVGGGGLGSIFNLGGCGKGG